MVLKSIQIKVSPNCQHCGSRYRSLAVAMVVAYTEENSGVSKPLPSTTLPCLHFSPASSTQATTWFYFWPSFFISSASSWFQVSSHSSPLCIVYNEPSALCSPALPQSPDTKQPLSNIYWADCSTPGLLGNCAGKSKQSKCHSHCILIILQSLQLTLTSYVMEHPTSYVPLTGCVFSTGMHYCVPNTTASKPHTTHEYVRLHLQDRQQRLREMGQLAQHHITSEGQSIIQHRRSGSQVPTVSVCLL